MDAEKLISALKNVNATRYLSAAGLVALLYDHLLTINDEIELIWRARNTLPKTLFLINRYLVPILMLVTIYPLAALSPGPSDAVCKTWFTIAIILGMISIANGHFIVLLRLWILWNKQPRLVCASLAVFVISQLGTFAMVTWVAVQMRPVLEYNATLRICSLTRKVHIEGLWAPGVFFEVVVFVTVCWNAMARPRESDQALTRVLYRDGLVFVF
ncbi:hypothetical protein HETIRDRAFT_480662, partial [Heterobasidion irregulare TC 32-1]